MLFYLYLLSVAISVIFTYVIMQFILEKLRNDKIKIINPPSWLEEVKDGVGMVLRICLPIFNLLYVFYLILFHTSIYQKFVTKLFLEGNAIFENYNM